ncbi:hypothetical protein OG372_01770 [Streptomyces sp. NBC_01020]|uniref:hypothetical protein n=1 Tax=unclassified Streptomyces TaxID=2593676 RepID=UPI00386E537D|nr:hypothetical protein OG372_01770 [Streptomyces sp. NBC_01020]WSX71563.1 hypothetical protein OG221_35905 [Streptomyces sp. NBC_00932]
MPTIRIETDPACGGRWTSLRAAGREWLWHRDEPRRPGAIPGDAFADAGGLEECVPTVRGTPDHGDAWTRPWQRAGGTESVDCPDFRLSRRIRSDGDRAVADYRLTAEPGYRFLWAAHALFDLSEEAHIGIRDGTPTRFYPDSGARWTPCSWPSQPGRTAGLDRLGPDDGTAVGAVVDTPQVYVRDGAATLRMAVEAEGQPVSVAVWRNLGGFPEREPYRSVGVEPMLGRVFDLAAARDGDAACVPRSGEVRWRLTLAAQAPEPWTQPAPQTEPESESGTAPEDTDRRGTHPWIC